MREALIENMLRWAQDRLGGTKYAGWCLSFIEDALEIPNDIEIFGGDCAKASAELYADAMRKGIPERGAFVFYDCLCTGEDGPVNWGHCGVSLGDGRVIHAWDAVRIDHYLEIERMTALTGDRPRYIGWVPVERVLQQKCDIGEKAMKILVLNGSPKKKSDTFRLTEAFLRGMNKERQHEVHIVNVIEKNIAPCRGCFGCWKRLDGHCVINDDQNAILDLYRSADVIIWSFPLYCYAMPSHLKAVLDRTIPLVKMDMRQEDDGTVRHEALEDFSRLHTLVICGCGFPDWDGNFDGLRKMCEICFGGPDMVCVPETPLLNVPQAAVVADPLLARFEAAGEEYASGLTLSAETIAALETPMIPKEEYIRQVNQGE